MAANKFPPETLLQIQSYLPTFSKHGVSRAWKLWKENPVERHSLVWNKIFRDDEWLSAIVERGFNPVLIGESIYQVYNDQKAPFPYHLALCIGQPDSIWGRVSVNDLIPIFWKSLHKHITVSYNGTREYYIQGTNILLNVTDTLEERNLIHFSNNSHLLGQTNDGYHSAYLYWKDKTFKPRKINISKVIGMKSLFGDIVTGPIVGLQLDWIRFEDSKTWQKKSTRFYCFHYSGVDTQVEAAIQIDGQLSGWKWKEGCPQIIQGHLPIKQYLGEQIWSYKECLDRLRGKSLLS